MSNRELVELFVGCLSEDKSSSRRPEDRYDLEDICAAAIEV